MAAALVLLVCAAARAQALVEPPPPAPRQVAEVELHLPQGADPAGLAELVAVRKGQTLSVRAVRRSVERLWATGRFTDVVVRARDLADGRVAVAFELTPVRQLARLTIEGNVVLDDEALRRASGLQLPGPWDADRSAAAAEALRQAYRDRGYDGARVEVTEEPAPGGGVHAIFTLTEGAPTRLGAVTLTGSPGLPLGRLVEALGVEVGQVLDRTALAAGVERVRALLRRERYWRARVGEPRVTPDGRGGARLALPVAAGPRVGFRFHGNHRYPDAQLGGVLGYDGGEPLDAEVAARLARRVAAFYRYRGFHAVRVRTRFVERPDGAEAVLAFDVEEGQPLRVTAVRFVGHRALGEEALRAVLAEVLEGRKPRPAPGAGARAEPTGLAGAAAAPRAPPAPEPEVLAVYAEDAYLEAASLLTQAYQEKGFLQAQVRFAGLGEDVGQGTARATFEVEEGPQARVREVALEGQPAGVRLEPNAGLTLGAPLSFDAVERGRQGLTQQLGREGYLFARVEAETGVDEGGEAARVRYHVRPGPQVRVGQVIVQGLTRTSEATVRASLAFAPGDVLDPEALFASQRALVLLNLFRQVGVRLIAPDTEEPVKDVVVEVHERARVGGDVSVGYFLAEGPRLLLDTSFPSVDGRGLNLDLRGKLNYVGWSRLGLEATPDEGRELFGWRGLGGRGNLSLTQPRLYGVPNVGARLDLIGERVHRPSYVFTRFAAVAGLEWTPARWLRAGLQYEVENDRVLALERAIIAQGRADEERLRFPTGNFGLHSLRPTASFDFRDDPANPTRGLLVSGQAELMRDLLVEPSGAEAFPIRALKLAGTVSVYAPLAPRAVLALSGRGGTVRHLVAGSRTIPPKRFFLGGATSLRGFREDGVIAQDRREVLARSRASCSGFINAELCDPQALQLRQGVAPVSLGGELFTLGKAELRLPAFGPVDLGLFLEGGNLWEDPAAFDPLRWRTTAGAGLRYATPVGPLALDLGVNLNPDRALNEPRTQIHFSIGLF